MKIKEYIVVETFGRAEYANIIEESGGENKIFKSKKDAKEWAKKNCSKPVIIKIKRKL